MISETISHYRLLEKLGSGGMGVLYAAQDLKLGRKVALKFLSIQYSSDPISLRRFEREARAASALNHPNICTIFEIDEADGYHFIAMELLKGTTLDHRLVAEKMERDELLDTAIQVTNGLEAAHREGIIHRDIKPANIFITVNGYVKLLDFGLAKLSPERKSAADTMAMTSVTLVSSSEALKEDLTIPGIPMGTMNYMSPEQARAEKLDARTDLFSFGAVLYEMATGRMAFNGNTSVAVLEAILRQSPPPAAHFNPGLPPELQFIISKAVEKDRNLRYQTAADVRADLQRLRRDSRPSLPPVVVEATPPLTAPELAPVPASVSAAPAPVPARVFAPAPPVSRIEVEQSEQKVPRPIEAQPAPLRRPGNLLVGAIVVVTVLALLVAGWWWAARRQVDGYLTVNARPGAQVLVDGKVLGTTASTGIISASLAPGNHHIQASLEGYDTWSGDIRLERGEQKSITAGLQPPSPPTAPAPGPAAPVEGTLVLQTNVSDAEVFVDGHLRGATDGAKGLTLQLDPGTYTIKLKKPGYRDSAVQALTLTANEQKTVALNLAKFSPSVSGPSPDDAYLMIQAPARAQVSIDGKASGRVQHNGTMLLRVTPGTHQVQVSLDGYEPWSSPETVHAAEKITLKIALKPKAAN